MINYEDYTSEHIIGLNLFLKLDGTLQLTYRQIKDKNIKIHSTYSHSH